MKLVLPIFAAGVGALLVFVGCFALWTIFSQIFAGTDKEGTNIYLAPFYALVAIAGVGLCWSVFRLVHRER